MKNFSIDTRSLKKGDYFVAIKGVTFNGHNFIDEAIRKGASGVIIDKQHENVSVPSHIKKIITPNTGEFLAEKAASIIKKRKIKLVGVTGSVGKTSTKTAIKTLISPFYKVSESIGNFNTLLGISLSILNSVETDPDIFVTEIGTYGRGNIQRICNFFPPDYAVVTNVYPVHLERMKTISNIQLAKQELVQAINKDGVAILNYDDNLVRQMSNQCDGKTIFYSEKNTNIEVNPSIISAEISLVGNHKWKILLPAVAVALSMNIPIMKIEAHVPSVKNDRGRLNIIPGKKETVIIDDTYNASQPSMEVALNLLLERKCRRRIAILGDMLELGSLEETAHAEILDQAIQIGDIIILIGERFARIASKKQQENLYLFSDVYDAKENIHAVFTPSFGDCILLKGSASIRLEKIAEDLIDSSISAKNTLVRQEKRWK